MKNNINPALILKTKRIKWYQFWRWHLKDRIEQEWDEYIEIATGPYIDWMFHFRPWNLPLNEERVMCIITEDDIQNNLAMEKYRGATVHTLVVPHKYKDYHPDHNSDVKLIIHLTEIMNPHRVIYV